MCYFIDFSFSSVRKHNTKYNFCIQKFDVIQLNVI